MKRSSATSLTSPERDRAALAHYRQGVQLLPDDQALQQLASAARSRLAPARRDAQ